MRSLLRVNISSVFTFLLVGPCNLYGRGIVCNVQYRRTWSVDTHISVNRFRCASVAVCIDRCYTIGVESVFWSCINECLLRARSHICQFLDDNASTLYPEVQLAGKVSTVDSLRRGCETDRRTHCSLLGRNDSEVVCRCRSRSRHTGTHAYIVKLQIVLVWLADSMEAYKELAVFRSSNLLGKFRVCSRQFRCRQQLCRHTFYCVAGTVFHLKLLYKRRSVRPCLELHGVYLVFLHLERRSDEPVVAHIALVVFISCLAVVVAIIIEPL